MDLKNKMVLFEGQDRCGKGTQINLLYKFLAANDIVSHISHYSNPGIKDIDKCIEWSTRTYDGMFEIGRFLNESNNSTFICDRAHLGEWVYGKKYRKYDANFIWEIEAKQREKDIKSMSHWFDNDVCLVVFTDLTKNLLIRDDGLGHSSNAEDFDWERERFKDAFDKSTITRKLYIDIDGKNIDEVHCQIKTFLKLN